MIRNPLRTLALGAACAVAAVAAFFSAPSAHALDVTRPAIGIESNPPLGGGGSASDPFSITVNFTGGFSSSQQGIFDTAAAIWDSIITGYQPGVTINGVTITADSTPIDGVGTILGSAGPTFVSGFSFGQGGFTVATQGIMNFDTADIDNLENQGRLLDVIVHEMGHVLGFGTLWDFGQNNVYVDGTGQYTGAAGVAAYQAEFDANALFAPVENGNPNNPNDPSNNPGTIDTHWDELAKVSNIVTQPLNREIMTGFLSLANNYLSTLTVESLVDIGFQVDPNFQSATIATLATRVPEPASGGIVLMLSIVAAPWRRR